MTLLWNLLQLVWCGIQEKKWGEGEPNQLMSKNQRGKDDDNWRKSSIYDDVNHSVNVTVSTERRK